MRMKMGLSEIRMLVLGGAKDIASFSSAFSAALPVVFLALTLVGCLRAPKKSGDIDESKSTFNVSEVSAVSSEKEMDVVYKIPKSRLYNFKVCLQDKTTLDVIRNNKFQIQSDSKSQLPPQTPEQISVPTSEPTSERSQEVMTDTFGCLHWSEEIKFSWALQPKFIKFERRLFADGVQRGIRTLSMAVNPWSGAFVDLLKNDLPQDQVVDAAQSQMVLLGKATTGQGLQVPLWLENVQVDSWTAADSNSGLTASLVLRPRVKTRNLLGQMELLNLQSGEFKVRVHLVAQIEKNGKAKRVLLAKSESDSVTMASGVFKVNLPLHVQGQPQNGQIEMALELLPTKELANVRGFEGVFRLGSYTSLTGVKSGELISELSLNDEKFSILNYLSQFDQKDQSVVPPLAKFLVSPVHVQVEKFFAVGTVEKKALLSLKACVTSPVHNGDLVRNEAFSISLLDQQTQVGRRTLENGCLVWNDHLQYSLFKSNELLRKTIHIRHASGFSQEIELIFEPWNSDREKFARDRRELESVSMGAAGAGLGKPLAHTLGIGTAAKGLNSTSGLRPGQSQLVLEGLSLAQNTDDDRYTVDHDLMMKHHSSRRISLGARIVVPQQTDDATPASASLPTGFYLMKFAIVRGAVSLQEVQSGHLQNPQMNSSGYSRNKDLRPKEIEFYQRVVEVNGLAKIQETIHLQSSDLQSQDSMADLYVQLVPLEQSTLNSEAKTGEVNSSVQEISADQSGLYSPIYFGNLNTGRGGASELVELTKANRSGVNFTSLLALREEVEILKRNWAAQARRHDWFMKNSNTDMVFMRNDQRIVKSFIAQPGGADLNSQALLVKTVGGFDYVLQALSGKSPLYSSIKEKSQGLASAAKWIAKPVAEASMLNEWMPGLMGKLRGYNAVAEWPTAVAEPEKEMMAFIYGDLNSSKAMQKNLCGFWHFGFLGRGDLQQKYMINQEKLFESFGLCQDISTTKGVTSVFDLQSFDHVFEVGSEVRRVDVISESLQISNTFAKRVASFYGEMDTHAKTFTPQKILEPLAESFKALKVFLAGFPFSYNISHSESNANEYLKGQMYIAGDARTLSVDGVALEIPVKKYEACTTITLKPSFIANSGLLKAMNESLSPLQKQQVLSRGLTICSGWVDSRPKTIVENYYTLATPNTGAQISYNPNSPEANLINVSLRGQGDFFSFRDAINGQPISDKSHDVRVDAHKEIQNGLQAAKNQRRAVPSVNGIFSKN